MATTLALLLSFAANTTGAPGVSPPPPACSTRGGTDAEITAACRDDEHAVEEAHARHDNERPSFAKSWVLRARGGGGSRVTAEGGERESAPKSGGMGGKAGQEVQLALINFPNRCRKFSAPQHPNVLPTRAARYCLALRT